MSFNIGQQITVAASLFDGLDILYKYNKEQRDIDFERVIAPAHLIRQEKIFKVKNRGELILNVETVEETERKRQVKIEKYKQEEEIMKVN